VSRASTCAASRSVFALSNSFAGDFGERHRRVREPSWPSAPHGARSRSACAIRSHHAFHREAPRLARRAAIVQIGGLLVHTDQCDIGTPGNRRAGQDRADLRGARGRPRTDIPSTHRHRPCFRVGASILPVLSAVCRHLLVVPCALLRPATRFSRRSSSAHRAAGLRAIRRGTLPGLQQALPPKPRRLRARSRGCAPARCRGISASRCARCAGIWVSVVSTILSIRESHSGPCPCLERRHDWRLHSERALDHPRRLGDRASTSPILAEVSRIRCRPNGRAPAARGLRLRQHVVG